jgi:hypothetical protein
VGVIDIFAGDGAGVAAQIAVALSLLMLGRRLYWLFVAAVGFVVVVRFASEYITVGPDWLSLALGIAVGLAGALFAVFLQKIAVALAGFAASAWLAYEVAARFVLDVNAATVAALVAGALGAIFASVLFDWALILLSSVAGAVLLVDSFLLDDTLALVVMGVVAIAGISIQANMLHRDREDQ